jgi:hypothetical protein
MFYVEDMQPSEELQITFKARALCGEGAGGHFAVYAYYRTDWRGEASAALVSASSLNADIVKQTVGGPHAARLPRPQMLVLTPPPRAAGKAPSLNAISSAVIG